jgi:hypothetical protein
MAVDNRTHSLGADASAPGVYTVGAPHAGPLRTGPGRAACRQRLSDDGKLAFTGRLTVRSTRFERAFAAIIIGDPGPGPQTARTKPGIADIAMALVGNDIG